MALLTASQVSRSGVRIDDGVAPTAGTGDTFANTGSELVVVKNDSGASINVTFDITATVDGAAVTDPSQAVADGTVKVFGPFPTRYYGSTMKFTCSAVTSVKAKVIKQALES